MSRTLWLISEDPSDAEVVTQLFKRRAIQVQVNPVALPDNRRGIHFMPQILPQLIETTKAARQSDDKIAVLIDAEWYKPKENRYNHRQVAVICRRFRSDVKLLWAVQELEAWILADSGACAWLSEPVQRTDSLRDPKEKLNSLLHKKAMRWRPRDFKIIFQQMRWDGDQHNRSLSHLLRYAKLIAGTSEA